MKSVKNIFFSLCTDIFNHTAISNKPAYINLLSTQSPLPQNCTIFTVEIAHELFPESPGYIREIAAALRMVVLSQDDFSIASHLHGTWNNIPFPIFLIGHSIHPEDSNGHKTIKIIIYADAYNLANKLFLISF